MTDLGIAEEIEWVRKATRALALELPSAVYDDYAPSVLVLCDRLTEAEAILNDLAHSAPKYVDRYCVMCSGSTETVVPSGHYESCMWRRAVEFGKGKQP